MRTEVLRMLLISPNSRIGSFLCAHERRCDACHLGQPHQFRHGRHAHLFHHPAAMNFDRLLGRAEFGGNLFVQQAFDDPLQHLKFARS